MALAVVNKIMVISNESLKHVQRKLHFENSKTWKSREIFYLQCKYNAQLGPLFMAIMLARLNLNSLFTIENKLQTKNLYSETRDTTFSLDIFSCINMFLYL